MHPGLERHCAKDLEATPSCQISFEKQFHKFVFGEAKFSKTSIWTAMFCSRCLKINRLIKLAASAASQMSKIQGSAWTTAWHGPLAGPALPCSLVIRFRGAAPAAARLLLPRGMPTDSKLLADQVCCAASLTAPSSRQDH